MSTSLDVRVRCVRSSGCGRFALPIACVCALVNCASPPPLDEVDWYAEDSIGYRLVTKDDFQAGSSNSVWGNVAHGAEICTNIVPAEDYEETGAFHAVMRPECSFWNKVIGPLGYFMRLLGLLGGVPVIAPVKQPDWYIIQHEQIHFAIMTVAARQLTQQLANLPPERWTRSTVQNVYAITMSHVDRRHVDFDNETSGTFRPRALEKWVRALEGQMERLCGEGPECRVRQGN